MGVPASHGLAIWGSDQNFEVKNTGCKPWSWSVSYLWFGYDFPVCAFHRICMAARPRLGARFVCAVFKSEIHQPETGASLVTVQCVHSVIAERLVPFFFFPSWRETAQWKIMRISKIRSISSIPTASLWLSGAKAPSLAQVLLWWEGGCSVILTVFVQFFLSKDSMGDNTTVFEGVPACWIVDSDTWQTVFPRCSRYAVLPCLRALSEGGGAAAAREPFLWSTWTRKCEHQPTEVLFLWL